MKIAMSEIIKLINKTINIEELTVDAQPGMAREVVSLIMMILMMVVTANNINKKDMIATLVIIISRKTDIAPSPCNSNDVKFILDEPAYLLARSMGNRE